jgi:hypothetical protein
MKIQEKVLKKVIESFPYLEAKVMREESYIKTAISLTLAEVEKIIKEVRKDKSIMTDCERLDIIQQKLKGEEK